MASRTPRSTLPERTLSAMQMIAAKTGFSHISEPLVTELRRLVDGLAKRVEGEPEKAT